MCIILLELCTDYSRNVGSTERGMLDNIGSKFSFCVVWVELNCVMRTVGM